MLPASTALPRVPTQAHIGCCKAMPASSSLSLVIACLPHVLVHPVGMHVQLLRVVPGQTVYRLSGALLQGAACTHKVATEAGALGREAAQGHSFALGPGQRPAAITAAVPAGICAGAAGGRCLWRVRCSAACTLLLVQQAQLLVKALLVTPAGQGRCSLSGAAVQARWASRWH